MKKKFKTPQELFWSTDFGNKYIKRNSDQQLKKSNDNFFKNIFGKKKNISSCIEVGANIGLNLISLKKIFKKQNQYAIEINALACKKLSKILPKENIYRGSVLDFDIESSEFRCKKFELVLSKTFLIHIHPNFINNVYDKLFLLSTKYILICEYFNPDPVDVTYRGHKKKLFKRDFAFEMIKRFNLKLKSYGFAYHLDEDFPQDNINWFLLEKK